MKKFIIGAVLLGLILFVLIQLVPYGRNHTNLPVVQEPQWTSAEARALAERACFDCHSHETVWPWYSSIAPVSWLVQRDVEEGRTHMNFSAWEQGEHGHHAEEAGEVLAKGEMPPAMYLILHSEARLTGAEKELLGEAIEAMGVEDDGREEEGSED